MQVDRMYRSCEIFRKYGSNTEWFEYNHDKCYGPDRVGPDDMEEADVKELEDIGWFWSEDGWEY